VTVTVGLAVLEAGRSAEYEQVKHAAATALRRAKTSGRNRVEITAVVPTDAEQILPGPQGGAASA
jgi:hypothetical protein